jgi:hypothetical protein
MPLGNYPQVLSSAGGRRVSGQHQSEDYAMSMIMKRFALLPAAGLLLSLSLTASGVTLYVDINNPAPAAPYTNWVAAATNIQDAVDAAVDGDQILVTNGVYEVGAKDVYGMSNRVAVTKALTVQSVNGPSVTIIRGHQDPSTVNGPTAVRCAYLTNGAVLAGFTLTNGATQRSSGTYDEAKNSGGGVWCESSNAIVLNSVLVANSADFHGGGAFLGTLTNCILSGNGAALGGGAGYSTLNNCTLTTNRAVSYGGGAYYATLNNCTLGTNRAVSNGGGTHYGTLNNCLLTGNSANSGGGTYYGTVNNSVLVGNAAGTWGGGSCYSTLNNCTLTRNSAGQVGGGAAYATLNNCIIYYNTAPSANYQGGNLNYCCTTPLPASGTNNLAADPLLASAFHLSADSPCRRAGTALCASGLDIDGEPWADVPSIGCDEYWSGSVTGSLSVAIVVSYTNVYLGSNVDFQAVIGGRVSASSWDFGDGVVVSNRPYASHAWSAYGTYAVVLRAYNESYPAGVAAAVTVYVPPPVHYVALSGSSPAWPYSSWETAATNIQDAVDAALAGHQILVSNGVYQAGATALDGMSNRVAVSKAVTVQSVNGPEVTVIRGYGPNGAAAVRCAYLTNGAVLAGFTLAYGATQTSGDSVKQQSGGGVWCVSASAVVSNCVVVSNTASYYAGGVCSGTLYDCTLAGNSGSRGGGAYSSTLSHCALTGNAGSVYGGGAYSGTLYYCTLSGNSGTGGGAYTSTLNNCWLTGNWGPDGGGAGSCTLNDCVLSGNSAFGAAGGGGGHGGGAYNCLLRNCTLTGNSAYYYSSGVNGAGWGGGAYNGNLYNCILYYNALGGNYYGGTLSYCCTSPLPTGGTGNTNAEPQLASTSHLSAASPCRGAGSVTYTNGVDIDGEPWTKPPSIGCDEYWAGSVTGALSVAILTAYTNVPVGFSLDLQAVIGGRLSASSWDFGDGTVLSNRPYASHAWTQAGDFTVVLRASNETYPGGVSASLTVHTVMEHYVTLSNATPVWPYGSWATAATNIQDAVDAAAAGALVWVSNGVYQTGARVVGSISNRVVVAKPIAVQSLNGPDVTVIRGSKLTSFLRCVYLTNGAFLAGFTLTNGVATGASGIGGGVYCGSASDVVSNCVIVNNSAGNSGGGACGGTLYNCILRTNSAVWGGGAGSSTLINCTLSGNSASDSGGGAEYATLYHCTLTGNSATQWGGGADSSTLNNCALNGNSASYGGGALNCTLSNCTLVANSATIGGGGADSGTVRNSIVYYNTAPASPNYAGGLLDYCCTTPLPGGRTGNFTNAPLLVDQAGGNLRLQSNSPCINAGNNSYAPGATDSDGNPRIVGGTVDVGAYECQSPALLDYYIWLQGYGLPTDASAVYADSDNDRMNNWQEWIAGTSPTNAASVLLMAPPAIGPDGVTLTWLSVAGRNYFVECATNLAALPAFRPLQTNILGLNGTTSFTDTNPPFAGPAWYRVGAHP